MFEGGNLDAAIKTADNVYELYLRVDSNTRGYCTYYYFKVTSKKKVKVQFNIINFARAKSLYSQGMKPYISTKKDARWRQTTSNCVFLTQPGVCGAKLQF